MPFSVELRYMFMLAHYRAIVNKFCMGSPCQIPVFQPCHTSHVFRWRSTVFTVPRLDQSSALLPVFRTVIRFSIFTLHISQFQLRPSPPWAKPLALAVIGVGTKPQEVKCPTPRGYRHISFEPEIHNDVDPFPITLQCINSDSSSHSLMTNGKMQTIEETYL